MLKSRTAKADLYHTASSAMPPSGAVCSDIFIKKPFILSEHGIYTREREEEIIRADWVRGIYKDLWIQQFRKIGICGYQYADKVTSLFEDARQFQIELGCDPKNSCYPQWRRPEAIRWLSGKDSG